jgi:hypothetical protein
MKRKNGQEEQKQNLQLLSNMQHLLAPFICDKTNTDGWSDLEIVWYHAFIQASHTFLLNHGLCSVPSTSIFIIHTRHAGNLHSSPQYI